MGVGGSCTQVCRQFFLLLWKNFILQVTSLVYVLYGGGGLYRPFLWSLEDNFGGWLS